MQHQQQQHQQGGAYSTPKRGTWSPEEDRRLLELVDQSKVIKWVEIAEQLGTRTSKQCRERYHQKLKPSLSHEPISSAESEQIERLVALYGKRWALIARHLKGRSDNVIKNWWNASLNRRRLTSVHLMPLNSPQDSENHSQMLSQSARTSPIPSFFDSASSSGYDDPGQAESSDFATRVLNNRPQGQPLDARPDAQHDYDMGNTSQDPVPSEPSRSPQARNSEPGRGDRMKMVAPPSIGVAFNPRYASDGSSASEVSCESNRPFNSATPNVPRSGSAVSSSTQSIGLPFANNEQFRSRVWSEFGLYSAELAKNTPSSVEALSLNRYSLGDPSFGTNFERRSTVCPSQLPSLFPSTSYPRPSFGDNNSENNSSVSDSSSAAQSSQAPTDFYSRENSGSSSQSETYSNEPLQKPTVSQQQGWQLNQTVEISGRAGVPFGGPEGMASSGSGSLGGPPGGLPALTSFANEQRIQDARFSPVAQKTIQPVAEDQAQAT